MHYATHPYRHNPQPLHPWMHINVSEINAVGCGTRFERWRTKVDFLFAKLCGKQEELRTDQWSKGNTARRSHQQFSANHIVQPKGGSEGHK